MFCETPVFLKSSELLRRTRALKKSYGKKRAAAEKTQEEIDLEKVSGSEYY